MQKNGYSAELTAPATSIPARHGHRRPSFSKVNKLLVALIVPAIVIAVWQLIGSIGLVAKTVLPAPWDIVLAGKNLIDSGLLFSHMQISIYRAASGFFIGGGLGLLFGIIVGLSTRSENLLDPSLQMIRTVPHLAVAPLFILWFGLGDLSKVLLIAMGAFFPLYVNTFLGIRRVDAKLFDVAKILEFSRWKQVRLLILPGALPNILLGVRLSLGAAWLSLVVAELMGSTEGVGYMIMDARQFSNTDIVFVGIIIFAVVGKLTDSLVRLMERHFLKWQDTYKG